MRLLVYLTRFSVAESVTNLLAFAVPKGSSVSLSPSAYVEMTEPADDAPSLDSKQIQIARAYYPPTNNLRIEWSAEEPIIGNTSPSP